MSTVIMNYGYLVEEALFHASVAPAWAESWFLKRMPEHVLRTGQGLVNITSHDREALRLDLKDSWSAILFRPRPHLKDSLESLSAVSQRLLEKALDEGLPLARFQENEPAMMAQCRVIGDWFTHLTDRDSPFIAKLARLTFHQALEHAECWKARRDACPDAEDQDAGIRELMALSDPSFPGWRWVELLTPEAKDREGEMMGSCVGDGSYDGLDIGGIYSLRDPENRPHVTLETMVEPDGAVSVVQFLGKGNKLPVERYHGAVIELANELQAVLVHDAQQIGAMQNPDGEWVTYAPSFSL